MENNFSSSEIDRTPLSHNDIDIAIPHQELAATCYNMGNNVRKTIIPQKLFNSKIFFVYITVFVVILLYFQNISFTSNTVIGVIVGICIIVIMILYNSKNTTSEKNLHGTKSSYIHPPSKIISNNTDFTDFIFSIQDFYEYNPQTYENMIDNLNEFLNMYNYVLLDNTLAGEYYTMMNEQKNRFLNNLHAIITTIPSQKILIEKLNTALDIAQELFNQYLHQIININSDVIKTIGFTNKTKIITPSIIPRDIDAGNLMDFYY